MQAYSSFIEGFRVSVTWPGAKSVVETRGWHDSKTKFTVIFRNGAEFTGNDPDVVIHKAETYYRTTIRLTGEAP